VARPPRGVPPQLIPELRQLIRDVFTHGYIAAIRPTLAISVAVLLAGAAGCLLLRRHTAPAVTSPPAAVTSPPAAVTSSPAAVTGSHAEVTSPPAGAASLPAVTGRAAAPAGPTAASASFSVLLPAGTRRRPAPEA
jgi:hypothetical protein